jgi:hypothetical protein
MPPWYWMHVSAMRRASFPAFSLAMVANRVVSSPRM